MQVVDFCGDRQPGPLERPVRQRLASHRRLSINTQPSHPAGNIASRQPSLYAAAVERIGRPAAIAAEDRPGKLSIARLVLAANATTVRSMSGSERARPRNQPAGATSDSVHCGNGQPDRPSGRMVNH